MDLVKGLNDEQRAAVLHGDGPMLVLAGAGSGKTRVLTHRIAYLIKERGIFPGSILAITFTNKASREMKGRIEKLVGEDSGSIWTGTFHSICVRILRRDIDKLGYDKNFVIFDTSDQQTVIKDCLKQLNLSDKIFAPRAVLDTIGRAKDELIDWKVFSDMHASDFRLGKIAKIYELYQKKLKQNNALDFDDIILHTIKLFLEHPPVLDYYQQKFRYVLVDEYQDTNTAQYALISLIAQKFRNLCVVGDDDQCMVEGTQVSTPDGLVPIEKMEKGKSVLCAAGYGEVTVGSVEKIIKKKYDGIIVKIKTKTGREIKATPNHIVFARLNPQQEVYYVYLMHKKCVGFRIGQTQGVRSRDGGIVNGMVVRLNQEHGDKMWIIRVCLNKEEAVYYEQFYSCKYGIPATVFHGLGRNISLSQSYIDKMFKGIDTEDAAVKLMEEHLLFEEYPHLACNAVTRGQSARRIINITAFGGKKTGTDAGWYSHRISFNTSGSELRIKLHNEGFNIRNGNRNTWRVETERREYDEADAFANKIACIDEKFDIFKKARLTESDSFMYMPASHMKPAMSLTVLDKGRIIEDIIDEVEFEHYGGNVYDLSVPHNRQYIAGGVVVHNSIYGWRGANIRNILDFEKEFQGCKVVKLEQNYRSTKNILDAANNVIKNNNGRKAKKLWTSKEEGNRILYRRADNEHEEALFVSEEISRLIEAEGQNYLDFAILYRMNAQSRVLEETFMKKGLPYKVVGGLKFYDRKEIKDIIAYLRVIHNPMDNISLKRIINVPKRGIGNATLDASEMYANERTAGIFSVISSASQIPLLSKGAARKLEEFTVFIGMLRALKENLTLTGLIEEILEKSGYLKELEDEQTVEAETRIENLKEFISVAIEFEKNGSEQTLEAFLEHVSLVTDIDNLDERKDSITMMTMHSAKGLEFPVVFVVGMEEGVFPGFRSSLEEKEMEEERRLCYVAITRARERLYLTNACCRTIFGNTAYNPSSRFVKEIPEELINDAAPKSRRTSMQVGMSAGSGITFNVGDTVEHKKFGIGTVSAVEKDGGDYKLEINFGNAGMKRLMAAFANLRKL